MYLLLDLSTRDEIALTLFDEQPFEHKTYSGRNRELLSFVHAFLEGAGKSHNDILGIAVIMQTGSFTSTRLAAVLANTWSFAKKIPVISVTKKQAEAFETMSIQLRESTPHYIHASYAAEPSIGKAKPLS